MRDFAFRIVNVFAEERLGGNALAVFEDGGTLCPETMQALALQFNLSETTFILPPEADTADYRVTVTQSYKLFHVLKDNGVTTQFFAYPIGGHSPSDPVRQRDVERRWIAWLEKYL